MSLAGVRLARGVRAACGVSSCPHPAIRSRRPAPLAGANVFPGVSQVVEVQAGARFCGSGNKAGLFALTLHDRCTAYLYTQSFAPAGILLAVVPLPPSISFMYAARTLSYTP